jgi:hypothetical protein
MTFRAATSEYESWLGKQLKLLPGDLQQKHAAMRKALFPFFRATYYRWAQLWPDVCKNLHSAPAVLAVGDLHVENFGTWRDIEGRLIWGINDFDEAWRLPYTNDLVRVVASAQIAGVAAKRAASSVLSGYRTALISGGRPLVLAENNLDLRQMAVARLKDPGVFWSKLQEFPVWREKMPKIVRRGLRRAAPSSARELRIVHRVAGLGSLGRQRFAALAHVDGGFIAREAKPLAPSACVWAEGRKSSAPILYPEILACAVRCHDPFVRIRDRWIFRRLAPDCSRIELTDLPRAVDEESLLYYMGWETANIHLGTLSGKRILADLKKHKGPWLARAARAMVKATTADWQEWKKAARKS